MNLNLTVDAFPGVEPDLALLEGAWSMARARFNAQDAAFFNAPVDPTISALPESMRMAHALQERLEIKDCLFLGIGGSALGPLCVLEALSHQRSNAIRFHFKDNVDPLDWEETLGKLDPKHTLLVICTKSGTTFETLAQALCALEWMTAALGETQALERAVLITDPEKGDLRKWATDSKLKWVLPIHPAVGGRFSVFTPVGLFAFALAGLDAQSFMKGAADAREAFNQNPAHPLLKLGAVLVKQAQAYPNHVMMPYSTKLKLLGSWFVQLWGESLGKDGRGFTPLAAVGATDQHSLLQLLRDGPNDKVVFFIRVKDTVEKATIPTHPSLERYPAFKLLMGHSLGALLDIEREAVRRVLKNQDRPSVTLELDSLDEASLGTLLFSFSVLTAFTGAAMQVNPFDQPGVEEGKVYIREALTAARSVP